MHPQRTEVHQSAVVDCWSHPILVGFTCEFNAMQRNVEKRTPPEDTPQRQPSGSKDSQFLVFGAKDSITRGV